MAATWVAAAHSVYGHRGYGAGIFMTEQGCPQAATFRDTPDFKAPTKHTLATSAPFCMPSRQARTSIAPAARGRRQRNELFNPAAEPIYVLTQSATSDVTYPFDYDFHDRQRDNFIYSNAILAINSAGNEGSWRGISSSGKGLNVLTVGNFDHVTNQIATDSSWRDPPNTRNAKPEVSAPGERIDAGTLPDGSVIVRSGTSQAAPHVAGMAANLAAASSTFRYRPYYSRAL